MAVWVPTKSSGLCEAHFTDDQFEQHRLDGLRKLKPNAVPTLFDYNDFDSRVKEPLSPTSYARRTFPKKTNRLQLLTYGQRLEAAANFSQNISSQSLSSATFTPYANASVEEFAQRYMIRVPSSNTQFTSWPHAVIIPSTVPVPNLNFRTSDNESEAITIKEEITPDIDSLSTDEGESHVDDDDNVSECSGLNETIANWSIEMLKRKLEASEKTVAELRQNEKLMKEKLSLIFNDNQMRNFFAGGKTWSEETMQKGQALRDACGVRGYKMLIKLGFPLPNGKTLLRRRLMKSAAEQSTPSAV